MASTYTPLGIELQATGENAGTWGTKTNTNLQIIEQISGGFTQQAVSDSGDTDLSVSDGDIHKAKKLAVKLKTDSEFYNHCSELTKQLYKKHYSEKIFLEKTMGILNETN